jgi:protein-S-isoprenylcysteine O-methyltransferase Ste14
LNSLSTRVLAACRRSRRLAVWLRWGWLVLLAPVCVAAVTELAIKREERHLEIRFGEAYRAYKARVRRWL